jgi:PAS domain S-box-containing protein
MAGILGSLFDAVDPMRESFFHRVSTASAFKEKDLAYWRITILFTVLLTCLIGCALVFFIFIWVALQKSIWWLLVCDLTAYGLCAYLLLSRRLSYHWRAAITLLACYGVGVAVIILLGPVSGGPMWLFTFAVMAGILLGVFVSIAAVGINAFTLFVFSVLYVTVPLGENFPPFASNIAMAAAGASFVVLNLVTSLSVAVLVRGLIKSHQKQKELAVHLAEEREELMAAKDSLETEVTERTEAEAALQRERDRAQRYLDIVGVILVALDEEGKVAMINKKGCEILGYPEDEIVGRSWFNNFIPEHQQEEAAQVLKMLLTGNHEKADYHENPIVTKTGEERMIAWHNTALTNGNGKVVGHLSSGEDITDRKAAEQALQESEAKFRGIAENTFDVIFITDLAGVITYISPSCSGLFQYQTSEMEGEHFSTFVQKHEMPRVMKRFTQAVEGRKTGSIEIEVRRKDGRQAFIELNSSLVYQKGELVGTQGIIRDITHRREMETRLLHAQKMESMGTLAGGIAHDFNNILGIIIGNSELALDELLTDTDAKEYVDEIHLAALRAKDIVKQILSVARQNPAVRVPIKIGDTIAESLKLMRATTPSSISVDASIANQTEDILGNSTEIHQIMMNLFTNAVDAMEGRTGNLRVHLETVDLMDAEVADYDDLQAGRFVKLIVEDTGAGIREDVINRIFDPYFTTKDVDKGTGMGLAVVYGIVKKHKGVVTVRSRVGQGTAFEILFPVFNGYRPKKPIAATKLDPGGGHILFVDDERHLLKMAKQTLERQGYTVTTASSGEEALEVFEQDPNQFDLVITDLSMPQITGDDLAKAMISICPDIPIIFSTGHSAQMDEDRAAELGAKAFLMKPFERLELALTVQQVLVESQRLRSDEMV